MRRFAYMVRFFWCVAPIPPLMAPAMAAVGVVAGGLVVAHEGRAAAALVPLLLLQMFAASSGFMVPARRGHYDLLLTGGCHRLAVALTHWSVSVAPGLVVYGAVAAAASLAGDEDAAILYGPGALAALALVSTVPWAATVGLPRFTGAIAWLLALAVAQAVGGGDALQARVLEGAPLIVELQAGVLFTLNPAALIAEPDAPAAAIAIPLLLAAGSMAAASLWLSGRDIPLEAAQ